MESQSLTDGTLESAQQTDERKNQEIDVRVAVIGNVDSGKSTLVGVLTRCVNDDGRGLARSLVFNYSHEQANGRTSSISHEIMGFKPDRSQVAPERVTDSKKNTWEYITDRATHLVTFLDLCGHEKYLKTTIFGLVGLLPDYAMIVIGANMGITRMAKEHIGLSLALKIPMFFVFTKIDIAPENVYKDNMNLLKRILASPSANRVGIPIEPDTDLESLSHMIESKACPIFTVSNVTGQGLDKLKLFISWLSSRSSTSGVFGTHTQPAEMLIDGVYMVTGVGVVVSGILKSGTVKLNDILYLGPDSAGNYKPVSIKGIHILRVSSEKAVAGQSVCFCIKSQNKKEQIKRNTIKKGNLLVDKSLCAQTVWEFDAEVVILHHATTIKEKYQPIIHVGVVRQAASVLTMTKELLRPGDQGLIRFRFAYHPELIHTGMNILFREGRTKGLGVISQIYPINN
jgi:GTPase